MKNKRQFFVKKLLEWFKVYRRSFPWRVEGVADPFTILVAELMLKKTRASNAIPVYSCFIEKYPNIQSTSDISGEELEKILQPLGLIKQRKKAFLNVFSIINNQFGGLIPGEKATIMEIQYLGEYTANAVLCFGFNKRVTIVDVNVTRICQRYFGIEVYGDPRVDKHIWELLDDLLPRRKFKEFNLALLDFGALVCTSKNPKCKECPLKKKCDYFDGFQNRPIVILSS